MLIVFARDHRLAVGGVGGHDLAGVHPDAQLEADAMAAMELGVEAIERRGELGGGSDRPQGIVLVQHGQPEARHDRVADELLDRPAMALDDLAERALK